MTIRPTAASSTRQPWETTPETRARKEPDPARDLGLANDALTGGRAYSGPVAGRRGETDQFR